MPTIGQPPLKREEKNKESELSPAPLCDDPAYKAAGKLAGKRAIISGADSGIGRAVAILFAKEGADVAVLYHENDEDAEETKSMVSKYGRKCLIEKGDVQDPAFARKMAQTCHRDLGGLDILVNNAAVQYPTEEFAKLDFEKMEATFRTNIFSLFYLTQEALKFMKKGAAIINSTSVTAYRGSEQLVDYSATKGAIVSFTRSLSKNLAEKGIRVNAVAPGPIWTPLVAATMPKEKLATFGQNTPMKRPGQPAEVAPCYVFLASSDSSYMSGQVLHPNGGEVVNG